MIGFSRRILLCIGWLIWAIAAQASPQINWGDMVKLSAHDNRNTSMRVDLRSRWETTLVGQVTLTNSEAYDPSQVWAWPSERFSSKNLEGAFRLHKGERMVARLTVFSEQVGTDFIIDLHQARLDAAHVSYRYDGGPWTMLSAGDTIAMDRWAQPDRQPSFNLPMLAGQMDVVVQIAHRGVLEMPAELENRRAFLEERSHSIWLAGMMVGVSLVMALMGLMMAWNYRRASFLSVTLMSAMMALVLIFGSGLGGMFVGTSSARFNDEIKFYVNVNWTATLPFVAALALGQRQQLKHWWWAAMVMAASGLCLALLWANYDLRDTAPMGVPILLVCVLGLTFSMMIWTWYHDICRNWAIVGGLTLQILSPLLPFIAYMGLMQNEDAGHIATLLSMIAGMLLLRGLFLQHRMGRQVMARANISPMRDVLTGLLSREGLQQSLYKMRGRIQSEHTCAVLIYIQLLDEREAMQRYGEEGFDMGMVQVAASLSSSISSVDGLARISRHAFATTVMMPPDPALATRVAQKILSRLMALASHGTPMANDVRLALSWLPLYGFRVDSLEQRSLKALGTLADTKRIAWVGGAASHSEAEQLLRDARNAYSTPSEFKTLASEEEVPRNSAVSSNLFDRIHRIEREMLHGVDTRFLVAEAERMSREINDAQSSQSQNVRDPNQIADSGATTQSDFRPTEQAVKLPLIKPA